MWWIKSKLTYECASRLSKEQLKPYMNEFGNINVKTLCFTDDDFFVSPQELEEVRKGTMKFETSWKPFDWPVTLIVGLLWALGTIFFTIATLSIVSMARWVWGKPK